MQNSLRGLSVLLVGPIPPPAGGMANQTRQLRQLLQSSGAYVELVAVNKPYSPQFIGRIPFLRAFFRLVPYIFNLFKHTSKADVVHIMANSGWSWHLFATPAIWVAFLLRTPVVVNYRGGHAEPFFERSWPIVKLSIDRASHVIVPSDYLKEVFGKYDKRADVVPNILNNEVFFPKEHLGDVDTESGPVLLVTRNLEPIYDIPTALRCLRRVMEKYPNAKLLVAGSGPEYEALNKLARQLSIVNNVEFLGRLDSNRIAELYREADVLLNPSTVDNSPNSVIEALASGLAVVTTNVGGIPKLVENEHDAMMIPPGQPDLMAEKVIQVLDDKIKRVALIVNGLEKVQRFYWSNVSQRLMDAYVFAGKGK
ncbi:MAG: glycosyltransferase family 4 protein [Aliiglaciecola sp.]